MASRRVELAKQLKLQGSSGNAGGGAHPGNVQINTSVDDTQKSIDELINAGVAGARSHEQNRNHFQRKKMPLSFFNPRTAGSAGGKSRGSSAGHSREGSSDDGGGGRHTLSSTTSRFGVSTAAGQSFGGAGGIPSAQITGGVIHQRQASAPALINYNIVDQHQTSHQLPFGPSTSNRPRPIAGSSAALPPVAHFPSKSLNTVAINSHMPPTGLSDGGPFGASSAGGSSLVLQSDVYSGAVASASHQLPPIAHQRSVKSCDFDVVGMGVSGEIQQGFGGGFGRAIDAQLGAHPYNSAYHSSGYVAHPHHASHQQIHPAAAAYHQTPTAGPMTHAIFPQQPQRGMSGVAGDLAAGAAVEFYVSKPQHHENLYWMDPRGKSQSLDPIALTATADSASPLAPGASPCSAITAPSSIASVNSSTTSTSQHQHQQQQQFMLQQQQQALGLASCSGNSMDDGRGPLPEGWAMSFDLNGDPYFIDHINKTTTWYDPRISREAQEETIKMRYSFLQKNNNAAVGNNNTNNTGNNVVLAGGGSGVASCSVATSSVVVADELKQSPGGGGGAVPTSPQQQQILSPQHQEQQQQQNRFDNMVQQVQQPTTNFQTHGCSPSGAIDRIRQLKLERNYMFERQQQLCREGLLNQVETSQQQPTDSAYYTPQAADYDVSDADAATNLNDSTMEVDFQQSAGALHHLDPSSIVPEFAAGDLNPHEFDKYLQITDNNRQLGVMR